VEAGGDERRDAARDEWKHICVDRDLLAGSARDRNARGGAWVGPQLAVALSLLPRGVRGTSKGKEVCGNGGLIEVRAETLEGRGGV
jgi:hypothetical protein